MGRDISVSMGMEMLGDEDLLDVFDGDMWICGYNQ